MQTRALTSLLPSLGYDPKPSLPRIIEIGDHTACRFDKDSNLVRANYERGPLLLALAESYGLRSFLEFGTGRGFSCGCLSELGTFDHIVTVDRQEPNLAKALLHQCGAVTDMIRFITKDTKNLTQADVAEKFDLFLIDAQHDGDAVERDLAFALSVARQNFVIVFDDYNEKFGDVQQAILRAHHDKVFDQAVLVMTDGWLIDERIVGDPTPCREREVDTGMVVATRGFKIPC